MRFLFLTHIQTSMMRLCHHTVSFLADIWRCRRPVDFYKAMTACFRTNDHQTDIQSPVKDKFQ